MFSSIFGDQNGTQRGPQVSKVKVSVVQKPKPTSTSTPTSSKSYSSNSTITGHLKVPSSSTSTSANKGRINGSSSPSKNGTSSPSPRPTLLKKVSSAIINSKSSSPRPAKTTSSPVPSRSPGQKRKANKIERVESESESESDNGGSDSESSEDALDPKPKLKRQKASPSGNSTPTSLLGRDDDLLGRKDDLLCLDQVDMRGEYNRGWVGFVECEEVLKGKMKGWASAGNGWGETSKGLEKYQAYFPQPGFENGDTPPSVELLYPAEGCKEKFILLTPTSAGEYNPISELRNALRMILEHYIPPSHTHIFGKLSDSLSDPLDTPSSMPSRLTSPFAGSLATPPPDSIPTETIGDALRKALAPNRRDGPGFLRAMERFNNAMSELQQEGSMKVYSKGKQMRKREWSQLVDFVHESAYSRVVGPYAYTLAHHPKHPIEVAEAISAKEDAYGELRHNFMSRVIEQTELGPNSVFVDLGSGVGNCVLQAAVQAGSRSYGFELLPVPAHCARLQLKEVQRRWAMWGLKGNLDVEVHEGDFRVHPMVSKRLREADVVLVNNEVFPSSLNNDLTNMFLDLKDGAKIVSLKPFVQEGFRMNENNCDSFGAIVKLSKHRYFPDWVTWKGDEGDYYIQTIDRSMRAKFEEELMSGRRSRR
ncbi:uncharacterized protein L199_000663 [Kwoniella botswanensis]|uniref:uncharacterized protein n=1 Tax=Kwoniella botswanensis TaxID=1268659 RepID=UPI00315DFA1B